MFSLHRLKPELRTCSRGFRELVFDERVEAFAGSLGQCSQALVKFRIDPQVEPAGKLSARIDPFLADRIVKQDEFHNGRLSCGSAPTGQDQLALG